ncbi:SDR family oxidoreductase [Paenibacillus profundus]|uniref:SDR family oxidoreductase n=1 Tax=Paenibacillus profundus TaxID=1173085 RepID=A0ABS8YK44_9BACL|nr:MULTISPECIES: SDR family oxidoreductase [Paenibacillus]MCE5170617.1 SDR family oxidoreductase [Paenibacillus profundus]
MKTFVIIGSEGEIGAEVKRVYHHIRTICLDKNIEEAVKVEGNRIYMNFDVTSKESIDRVASYLHHHSITIDGIIYLAGINYMTNFYDVNYADWANSLDINAAGFLFCLKGWYDLFSQQIAIVCIASQNGVIGHENRVSYGPSKAALIQLVKNLTVDFSQDQNKDIKINSISPTYVLSEKNKAYFETMEGKKLIKRIPYKKLIHSTDVAAVIKFLMSDESKAIRGQNIIVDYGYTIV